MAYRYRWMGARPLRRDDRTVVPQGKVFEATEREHERIMRRRSSLYVLVPDVQPEPPSPEPSLEDENENDHETAGGAPEGEGEGEPGQNENEQEQGQRWPIKMDPRLYLRLHPRGVHADLARELLGISGE